MKIIIFIIFIIFNKMYKIKFDKENVLNYEKIYKIMKFKNYLKIILEKTEQLISSKENAIRNNHLGSLKFYKNMKIVNDLLVENEESIVGSLKKILEFIHYLPMEQIAFLRFYNLEKSYNKIKIKWSIKNDQLDDLIKLELKDFIINNKELQKNVKKIFKNFRKILKYNKIFRDKYLSLDIIKALKNSKNYVSLFQYFCQTRTKILEELVYTKEEYDILRNKKINLLNILSKANEKEININKNNSYILVCFSILTYYVILL